MRTTIDLPDPLFREVKATAARKGLLLKEFIAAALIREVGSESGESKGLTHRQRVADFLAGIQASNTVPVPKLDRDELHDRN